MAHLLLIDDDPDLLPDQMRQVFPAPAHGVEIAHTGREGLERALDGRPDVILLDLRLPDQSGLDVLKQLRQIDARIPVVLVTVVRSADAAIEAMRQGAYDYLLKPLDLQKLDRVLGEALKVARLMRQPAGLVLWLTVTALWRWPTAERITHRCCRENGPFCRAWSPTITSTRTACPRERQWPTVWTQL